MKYSEILEHPLASMMDHLHFQYPGPNVVVVLAHLKENDKNPFVLCVGESMDSAIALATEKMKGLGWVRYDEYPENFRSELFPETPAKLYKKQDVHSYAFLSFCLVAYSPEQSTDTK
jgi:hypothetical protein